MPPGTVTVRLLGGFSVELDGARIPDTAWRRRRAAELVKLLALAPRHRLPRELVVDTLWPRLRPDAGAANLRKTAYHARRALGTDDAVVLEGGVVELAPGARIATDVERFESAAGHASTSPDPGAGRNAARLYPGDLLPEDRYADWCRDRRAQLRREYLDVLCAGQLWGRVVDVEPAHEGAHREIIRGHLQSGNRTAAIRQFERMRTVLRTELGVSPDADSLALYERVLSMDAPDDVPTPAERARSVLAWGIVHWQRSDLEEAERAAAEARALAIDAGLGRELADASELLGLVAYAQGRWREVFGAEFVEAVRRSPELGSFVFDANMCMSEFALHELDGIPTMGDFAEDILAAAADGGSLPVRGLGLLLRAESAFLGGGDGAAAAVDLMEAVRLHEQTGSITGQAIAASRLATVELLRGRHREARRLHEQALGLAAASPVPNHLLLFVYGGMLEESRADAAAVVAEGEAAAANQRLCDPCSMPFHVGATTVWAREGQLSRAHAHLAEAERIATMWQGGPWHAAVTEARARLCDAEGADPVRVTALLTRAADTFAASQRPRDEARCRAAIAATGRPH